jgi:hypothetical protein
VTRRVAVLLLLASGLTACAGAHRLIEVSRTSALPTTQWVDTHGIEVAVPASWRLGRGVCGTPKANTVLWNQDGILTCLTPQPPGLSVVEFGSILRRPPGWYRRHTTRVTIDGARARRWDAGMVAGSHEVQLSFPRRGISVTALSPDRPLLRRILASVRTVRVNADGCPTRPHPTYRLGKRPSSSQSFLPRGAVGVVGCSYKGRWLDMSNRSGRHEAARLARAFDAAPYGFSHAHRGSILPSFCRPSWRESLVIATFEYSSGRQPISVSAHLSGCSRLGASNGRSAVRLRSGWVDRLIGDSHYAGDYLPYGA